MTTAQELARAVAADLEPETATELEHEMAGLPPAGGGTRAFGIGEAAALAGFLWSATQVVLEVRAKRHDEADLVADLANGLEVDPRLAARLAPEKRLGMTARILDRLLPASFGQPTPEQIAAGKAERARWVSDFIAQRQKESNVPTRSWRSGDIKTRNFVGGATLLMPFADQDNWIVYKPIGWMPSASDGPDVVRVDVPMGFVTDLASVPWYLWSVLNRIGRYGNAAIYHDWLYWKQDELPGVTRAVADTVFERAMNDMGVGAVTRNIIYLAVRARGGGPWDENAKAKAAGDRRVLKRFPDDPTITWEDWRRRRDVFA